MNTWEIIIIGIGLSMDAAAVSLCNGLMEKQMFLKKTALMVILFGGFQGLMPIFGYYLGSLFSDLIHNITIYFASGVLVFLGFKMIYDQWKHKDKPCAILTFSVILILALVTSIDAFLVGLTFAFLNVEVYQASLIIALVTVAVCILAVFFGTKCGNILKNKAVLFGGIILVGIGIKILFAGLIS
jgi:putative Mn2+ efflux pump MntP